MGSPAYQEPGKGNTKKKRGYYNGSRSSENNIRQIATYTKVLEHIIIKIQ